MPGRVQLIGHQLLFRFPYDPETNSRLRIAADNRVRWDSGRHGFTLLAESLSRSPSLITALTRFITENGFDVDPDVRRLFAFREVRRADPQSLAGRPPAHSRA